jgi:O-succinylbenzoate synthase
VRVRGEEGGEGWGECVAGETPAYSAETTDTAWQILVEHLIPAIVGRERLGPEEILAPVEWIHGHPMAKAAVEMAVWDLQGRESGVPLWDLLGGRGTGVASALVIGIQPTRQALLERVEAALERGYAAVKLKIEPGKEKETVIAARERFPEAPLAVDANGAYAGREGPGLDSLDSLGLLWIEQPLGPRDFLGHARLQAKLRTPICLDESIGSREELLLALELESCRAVSIKPGCVGGHRAARELHDLCRERGVPLRCGGMLESGIGRAHNLALATLPGFILPGDISEPSRYWVRDLIPSEMMLRNGLMTPPDQPGIGITPDLAWIEEMAVRRSSFGAA